MSTVGTGRLLYGCPPTSDRGNAHCAEKTRGNVTAATTGDALDTPTTSEANETGMSARVARMNATPPRIPVRTSLTPLMQNVPALLQVNKTKRRRSRRHPQIACRQQRTLHHRRNGVHPRRFGHREGGQDRREIGEVSHDSRRSVVAESCHGAACRNTDEWPLKLCGRTHIPYGIPDADDPRESRAISLRADCRYLHDLNTRRRVARRGQSESAGIDTRSGQLHSRRPLPTASGQSARPARGCHRGKELIGPCDRTELSR